MRDIPLILKVLKKQMTGPFLLILQIVITFTVIVNATYIISDKTKLLDIPTGADQENSFYVSIYAQDKDMQNENQIKSDMAQIRSLNTVTSAAPINTIPLIGMGKYQDLYTDEKEETGDYTAKYYTDNAVVDTLDMEILIGEDFTEQDVLYVKSDSIKWPDSIIITKAFAEFLYKDDWRQAVSKLLYVGDTRVRVKGIVDKMQSPWYFWRNVEFSIFVPSVLITEEMKYLVRAKKGQKDIAISQVEALLLKTPGRMINKIETLGEVRDNALSTEQGTVSILKSLIITLSLITAFGIIGQASYSINARKKQIGTRRALGASKLQIIQYFLTENILVSTIGILLGMISCIALNLVLVDNFSLPRLPFYYLGFGVLSIYIISLLSVLYPAYKAANISPAIATREM
ncbi:ABC transporter permease [Pseudoalteromonas denitrificans]|uniref:Putative ABC transport system permease protein n=1 Tax=Pseudoalteromonas denitrificans DSM 6059 TaxID=1123010 RepID=A0A1I1NCK9_9GAMM|nr:FtsX-like permease family protein [Pseudoalteromonas denitrificans]SFC92513.1 putative ABC transport system permease protein [Pseudoalteromonas denitrificans DSM 6059]